MRCCTIKLKRAWSYCPGCGEAIEWPPTRAQLAKREADRIEHEQRMETDPAYRQHQEFLRKCYEAEIREFAEDTFVYVSGPKEDKDVAV